VIAEMVRGLGAQAMSNALQSGGGALGKVAARSFPPSR
jgi:hypothetical protein